MWISMCCPRLLPCESFSYPGDFAMICDGVSSSLLLLMRLFVLTAALFVSLIPGEESGGDDVVVTMKKSPETQMTTLRIGMDEP